MNKEIEKIKEEKMITLTLREGNLEVMIRYPKSSTLKRRFEMLDKIRGLLQKY